jgi:hypothetical protein
VFQYRSWDEPHLHPGLREDPIKGQGALARRGGPLVYTSKSLGSDGAFLNTKIRNADERLVATLDSVEMRRIVVSIVHMQFDTTKRARNAGH